MVISTNDIDIDDWVEIFEDYLEIKNELRSGSAEFISVQNRNFECEENYKIRNNQFGFLQSSVQGRDKDYTDFRDSENSLVSFRKHSGDKQPIAFPDKSEEKKMFLNSEISIKPKAKITNRGRLKHSVEFSNVNSVSKQTADIKGCEIWYKIEGGESAGETGFKYLSTDTNSPHIVHFRKEHSGKIVSYKLRWINSRNEIGPWSETESARIRFIPQVRIRPDIFILFFQKLIM